ncbi:MAG: hypothetical protein LBU11_13300 [Zoogloeaceae bacterium]|jgi:hypothetical protein|nr:hypothetical protein [Zoogloeaceae bacterium]
MKAISMSLPHLAVTRYEDYAFTSFFERAGVPYGVNERGVWRLDDAKGRVAARVDFGKLDFGGLKLKCLVALYLESASPKPLAVGVGCSQGRFEYLARNAGEELRARRVDCGRGLRGTAYDLELVNPRGESFTLACVEALLATGNRRI